MNSKKQTPAYRPVLLGFVLGVLIFAGGFSLLEATLPSQAYVGSGRNYGYVYSGAKSSSVDFALASAPADSVFLFGSSELSTPESLIPQVPSAVFGQNDYGIDLQFIGEAYDQSLWHAIAAGAYGGRAGGSEKKVAIIVSPTWFADGGLDAETFKMRFSYSLYRQFCDNPAISESSKRYLADRLLEQGIDQATVDAGLGGNIVADLNDLVLGAIDDLRLRSDLQDVRPMGMEFGPSESEGADKPDFDRLKELAVLDAEAATNNDWGYDVSFWDSNIAGRQDILKNTQLDETYQDTPEYEDLAFFLRVCKESGLEPLVIVSPVSGPFFDLVGISSETRRACYDRILSICQNADVPVADFSEKEYEEFFLHDIVHFGWTGWLAAEEAIYDHVRD